MHFEKEPANVQGFWNPPKKCEKERKKENCRGWETNYTIEEKNLQVEKNRFLFCFKKKLNTLDNEMIPIKHRISTLILKWVLNCCSQIRIDDWICVSSHTHKDEGGGCWNCWKIRTRNHIDPRHRISLMVVQLDGFYPRHGVLFDHLSCRLEIHRN